MKYLTWGGEAELGINFCHIHMVLVVLLLKSWRHTIDTKQDYVNVVIFNKITITTM